MNHRSIDPSQCLHGARRSDAPPVPSVSGTNSPPPPDPPDPRDDGIPGEPSTWDHRASDGTRVRPRRSFRLLLPLLVAAIAAGGLLRASPAVAGPYLVFTDDRTGFDAALAADPFGTVIDSGGAFAADPTAAAGAASLSRTGAIGSQSWAYSIWDVNFSNAPTGRVAPGASGGDVSSGSTLNVEVPAIASSVTGRGTFGIDNAGGDPGTKNAVLVDFTTTPGGLGVGHFGLDLIDFEATSAFTRGELRLYDAGVLVFSHLFDWGSGTGKGEIHFLGVVAVPGEGVRFDQAMVVIGDDNGNGNAEGYGADRFTFGSAAAAAAGSPAVTTPEPGSFALFGLGAAGLAAWAHRRRRRAATHGAADREPERAAR